jgi:lipopolysaccharide assembly protein A
MNIACIVVLYGAKMNKIFGFFWWVIRILMFFILLIFTINNKEEIVLKFFQGLSWSAPLVVVLLISFILGLLCGVLGMSMKWWRQRQELNRFKKELAEAKKLQVVDTKNKNPVAIDHAI